MNIKPIIQVTPEQIAILQAAGYAVEDMGAVHGPDFVGQYRWMKGEGTAEFDFQDWGTCDTPEAAWSYAQSDFNSKSGQSPEANWWANGF